jgi:SPP1 gp7 family putative phage head morphogenesis protein
MATTDWAKIENLRKPYYRKFSKDLERKFSAIGDKIGKIDTDSIVLFRLEANAIVEKAGIYSTFYDNIKRIVLKFGSDSYNDLLPQKAFNIFGGGVIDKIRKTASFGANKVESTTKKTLGRIIDKGLKEGQSIPKIAKNIKEKFKTSKKRSTTIARTETVGASNMGSFEGAAQTGLALNKFWIATKDKRTRKTHKRADGQTVGMNEKFRVGNSRLEYPGDKAGEAKEIINCRCAVGYKEA